MIMFDGILPYKKYLYQVNATNIFKETLTPRPMRKDMSGGGSVTGGLQKSHSCSSIKDQDRSPLPNRKFKFDNNLTVHVSSHVPPLQASDSEAHKLLFSQSNASIPIITTESFDDFKPFTNGNMNHNNSQLSVSINVPPDSPLPEKEPQNLTWTTMTPQQISIWIDK